MFAGLAVVGAEVPSACESSGVSVSVLLSVNVVFCGVLTFAETGADVGAGLDVVAAGAAAAGAATGAGTGTDVGTAAVVFGVLSACAGMLKDPLSPFAGVYFMFAPVPDIFAPVSFGSSA